MLACDHDNGRKGQAINECGGWTSIPLVLCEDALNEKTITKNS